MSERIINTSDAPQGYPGVNVEARKAFIVEQFQPLFGKMPTVWGRAPGRVDLMGSHTDYNLGHVMLMTLDRDTWLAARPCTGRRVSIYSLNVAGGGEFSLDDVQRDPLYKWTDYVRGMAKVLQDAGYELTGFDGLIHSTVPLGSGLSSSAAIEMATAVVFQLLGRFHIEPIEMARLGQKAENQFVGVNCGILDQYSSALGREGCALLLDCRDLTSRDIPIHEDLRIVICDTRAERNLDGTEYAERRAQCEQGVRLLKQFYPAIHTLRDVTREQLEAHRPDLPLTVAKRCQFILEEDERALQMAEVLPSGNRKALRDLFHASYAGARDLYGISVPAMEAMMDAMMSGPGVVAARQAGAGFGGCMVALVEAHRLDPFVEHVMDDYAKRTGIQPNSYAVTAGQGAGVVQVT